MVSGLELDFRGLPFVEMLDLSWLVRTYAGDITELVAYCSCGAKSQRRIDGNQAPYGSPIIMVGDFYEPVHGSFQTAWPAALVAKTPGLAQSAPRN